MGADPGRGAGGDDAGIASGAGRGLTSAAVEFVELDIGTLQG